MIFIGRVGHGPKLDRLPISGAIDRVRDTLREELGRANQGPSIDLVVHVPGSLGEPDFEGIRVGRLSRAKQMVQAEIAVPRALAVSDEPSGGPLELVAAAILAGAEHFSAAGIGFDSDAHGKAVRRTAERLGARLSRDLRPMQIAAIPPDAPLVEVRLACAGSRAHDSFAVEDALISRVEAVTASVRIRGPMSD